MPLRLELDSPVDAPTRRTSIGLAPHAASSPPPVSSGGLPTFAAERDEFLSGTRDRTREAISRELRGYQPRAIDPETWAAVGALARHSVDTAEPTSGRQALRLLKPTGQYLAWRRRIGLSLGEPADVFRAEDIERFVATGCDSLSPRSRATYRSALRTVGEANVGWATACPNRGVPITASSATAPYTPAELASIVSASQGQSTEYRRHNALALITLARGAGLTTGEIASLVGTDIVRASDGLRVIRVPGPHAREVVARRTWAEQLGELAELAGHRAVFRSSRATLTDKDIARFCERLRWSHAPHLSVNRLRVTWMLELLQSGVPIQVVAGAAGITAPAVARYVVHLAPPPAGQVRQWLAGADPAT